ncbi:helix-turn-helix transcriptional regulator [Priestia aryabhattai]|uniref:helix-turn-helix domain-containing protein n=1 Tax=Priestia aryabhattai TaxID=412384 RepID=UPI001C8DB926|nr:helix-turn-helix transcriptional regulator [Priestia aryabhattai]MBY0077933.1 helix-turn-helix transcriptional regulator [Priestia aryabhattai]
MQEQELNNLSNDKDSTIATNNNITGDRLRILRKKFHLRQEDVGEVINRSKSTVAGYESGFRSPDKKRLDLLAELYHTSVDYLLGRTDNPSPTNRDNEPRDIRELIKTNDFTYNGKKLDNKDLDLVLTILERIADEKS